MRQNTKWVLAGVAAILVVAGLVAAGNGRLWDDDGEDTLDVSLQAGDSHEVTQSTSDTVRVVEADYELRNVGTGVARVTLTLASPDGAVLDSDTQHLEPGEHIEIEVGHSFGDTDGPSGTYTATLVIEHGEVRLTEGGVDINEDEDGEDGEDD